MGIDVNAGARLTRKNGNSGTSRRNSRYENAFSVKPALIRSPNGQMIGGYDQRSDGSVLGF